MNIPPKQADIEYEQTTQIQIPHLSSSSLAFTFVLWSNRSGPGGGGGSIKPEDDKSPGCMNGSGSGWDAGISGSSIAGDCGISSSHGGWESGSIISIVGPNSTLWASCGTSESSCPPFHSQTPFFEDYYWIGPPCKGLQDGQNPYRFKRPFPNQNLNLPTFRQWLIQMFSPKTCDT